MHLNKELKALMNLIDDVQPESLNTSSILQAAIGFSETPNQDRNSNQSPIDDQIANLKKEMYELGLCLGFILSSSQNNSTSLLMLLPLIAARLAFLKANCDRLMAINEQDIERQKIVEKKDVNTDELNRDKNSVSELTNKPFQILEQRAENVERCKTKKVKAMALATAIGYELLHFKRRHTISEPVQAAVCEMKKVVF